MSHTQTPKIGDLNFYDSRLGVDFTRLEVGPGDEVTSQPVTYTASCSHHVELPRIMVDIQADTFEMDHDPLSKLSLKN